MLSGATVFVKACVGREHLHDSRTNLRTPPSSDRKVRISRLNYTSGYVEADNGVPLADNRTAIVAMPTFRRGLQWWPYLGPGRTAMGLAEADNSNVDGTDAGRCT